MKYFLLSLALLISTSIFANTNTQYLITNHSPHYLKDISKYTEVVFSEGRTLIVKIKPNIIVPKKLKAFLKKITKQEVLNYTPILKESFEKNPKILKLIKDVSVKEMQDLVEKISGFTNRRSGTNDNFNASKWIESEFKSLGLETELDCFQRRTCNVYGRFNGANTEEIILVEAHLDSVGHDGAGADDNASGVAGLLMIAKRVVSYNPKKSFIFFATNGEEQGLLGAEYYVKKLKKLKLLDKIKFVINMDMIGYNKTSNKVDLETNKTFIKEAEWMADLVSTYTSLTPNIVTPAWGSDHVPFLDKKIPSILTIEHWPSKTPCYHSYCDLPDHLTYDYGIEIVKLNIVASIEKSEE